MSVPSVLRGRDLEAFAGRTHPGVLVLFDVDGVLSPARSRAEPHMLDMLRTLRTHVVLGCVSGSPLDMLQHQLGDDLLELFDFSFPEHGLTPYMHGRALPGVSLTARLGERDLARLSSFCLRYIADLDIPVKRGTFFQLRTGTINVSPVGRDCSREERLEFFQYDATHKVRANIIAAAQAALPDLPLSYAIGGQISFDVFPKGWDKTFCLRFVHRTAAEAAVRDGYPPGIPEVCWHFDNIHFFGDRVGPDGNDHTIYESPLTTGHAVQEPADTLRICRELWLGKGA